MTLGCRLLFFRQNPGTYHLPATIPLDLLQIAQQLLASDPCQE